MTATRLALAFCTLAITAAADAATTVRLPGTACPGADLAFRSGFEAGEAPPHDPSSGSGGAFPGNVTRTVAVSGLGTRSYYLHLPQGYASSRAWPLLLALRGQSLPTSTAAQQVRDDWAGWADSQGFIVAAPAGNSTQGGWGASGDGAELGAVLDDVAAAYNVERSRIYLWGFSAGAHFAHALALANTDYFAAYGVSAGGLTQYACSADGAFQPTCAALLAGTQPKIPVDIHLGNTDPLYTQYGAGDDPARLRAGGWADNRTLRYTLFAGGHTYTVAQLGEIWNHLCPFALRP
jgi:poly(3-hydroxybutyrate) depolymerase